LEVVCCGHSDIRLRGASGSTTVGSLDEEEGLVGGSGNGESSASEDVLEVLSSFGGPLGHSCGTGELRISRHQTEVEQLGVVIPVVRITKCLLHSSNATHSEVVVPASEGLGAP
jgi:hypothetical protein